MKRIFRLGALAIVASLLAANSASAQCSLLDCNMLDEHWFTTTASDARVGMVQVSGGWRPAYCFKSNNEWRFGLYIGPIRAARALTADSSVCGGSGNNKIVRLKNISTSNTTCVDFTGAAGGSGGGGAGGGATTITLRGFDNAGFTFSMSGGGGNDTLTSNESATLCGGAGNDVLVGGTESQYISGGSGNDYVDGRGGYDNIRGDGDNDVLRHVFTDAVDKVRGDSGNDCLIIESGPNLPETSCGPQVDKVFTGNGVVPPIPECEDHSNAVFTWCCGESGRHCDTSVIP